MHVLRARVLRTGWRWRLVSSERVCCAVAVPAPPPEIQYKKPQFQYTVCQECGFLYLTSGCRGLDARAAA
eukprot:3204106-Rhodomonas_salina.1